MIRTKIIECKKMKNISQTHQSKKRGGDENFGWLVGRCLRKDIFGVTLIGKKTWCLRAMSYQLHVKLRHTDLLLMVTYNIIDEIRDSKKEISLFQMWNVVLHLPSSHFHLCSMCWCIYYIDFRIKKLTYYIIFLINNIFLFKYWLLSR